MTNLTNALKVAAYHMEEVAHGLRSGELGPDDASILLDQEAVHARRAVAESVAALDDKHLPEEGR